MKRLAWLLAFVSITNTLSADSPVVQLAQVAQKVWVHSSCKAIDDQMVDSNGLVIDCGNGVVLVDTCWDEPQTAILLKKIDQQFHKPILLAIVTHAHADRIGGIRTLLNHGVKVISTRLTARFSREAGYPEPSPELDPIDTRLRCGDTDVEIFFPGPGHTTDNMVVWVPGQHVLFGGCLIKSKVSTSLGNVADADLAHWAGSVKNLEERFRRAMTVIPGHGPWGNIELLDHTIALCLASQE